MKGRKHRDTGGKNDAEEDLSHKNMEYTKDSNVNREAEERKAGGRAKRKRGGIVHHEKMHELKHAKHVGKVHGEKAKEHAGRKPRKSGGRTGSDSHPYSSARRGEVPAGRTEQTEFN